MTPRRGDDGSQGASPGPISEPSVEREVDVELAFHLDMRAKELEEEGLSPSEARAEAFRAFGDRTQVMEACVDIQRRIRRRDRAERWVLASLGDLRVAGRGLLRRPGFSALAVVTLAIGIGAVTAIFSLVDATLLKPLPYPHSDQLVTVWETSPAQPKRSVAPANFLDWQTRSRAVNSWAALRVLERTLSGGAQPQRLTTGSVTRAFFGTLGVEPRLGRGFDQLDPGSNGPAAVLSHEAWLRHFAGSPDAVGQVIHLDDSPYEVVGVARAGFDYPRGVGIWTWSPLDLPEAPGFPGRPEELKELRDARFISVVGRLAAGIGRETAQTELDGIAAALRSEHPLDNLDAGVRVVGLQDHLVAGFRNTVLLLFAAVGLVLVIACANVANLLLVRAIERRQELAVRVALGASGSRLLRLHLSEGLVLGLAGAGLGVVFAGILIRGAGRWSWVWGDAALQLDVRVIAVVLALTGLTTLVFGALPAVLVRGIPSGVLGGHGTASLNKNAGRARQTLLALEVALAFALVLSTGLTVRTVLNLRAVDLGFDSTRLATVRVFLGPDPADPAGRASSLDEMVRAVVSDAGVEAVGVAGAGPVSVGPWAGLRVEGMDFPPGELPDVGWQFVSPQYFATLSIPLLRGRTFTNSDDVQAQPVAIINSTLARQVFGATDPVGRRINTGIDGQGVWVEVVGVAGDTRNRGPVDAVFPTLYRPMAQSAQRAALLTARLHGAPDAEILGRIEALVRGAVPNAPVTEVGSGTQLIEPFTRGTQTTLGVLGTLAAVALLLSAIGLYGVTSYSVTRRTRDLGVRLALGARAASIIWLVLVDTLRPCVAGLVMGLLASLGVAWTLRRMLFDVVPYDPVTIVAVGAIMVGVATIASLVPALRASALDPAITLRE